MSQNSLILPTTGTISGLQMTQYSNLAFDSLNTLNSGASAPSSAEAGSLWHNTSANTLNIYSLNTSSWIPLFYLDESGYAAYAAAGQTSSTIPSGAAGEHFTSTIFSSGAIPISSNSPKTVTSVSVSSAGKYLLAGTAWFVTNSSTVTALTAASISTSSNGLSNPPTAYAQSVTQNIIGNLLGSLTIPTTEFITSSAATFYLVSYASFTTAGVNIYGQIDAWRI